MGLQCDTTLGMVMDEMGLVGSSLHDDLWHAVRERMSRAHLLCGPPGSGKTSAGIAVARAVTGVWPVVVSLDGETMSRELRERVSIVDWSTRVEPGPLVKALREGRVILINEWSTATADVRALVLAFRDNPSQIPDLLDEGDLIDLEQSPFCIIATENVESGVACRRNTQREAAIRSGFMVWEFGKAPVAKWLRGNYPHADQELVDWVVETFDEFADISEEKDDPERLQLCYRNARLLMEAVTKGLSRRRAIEVALVNHYIWRESLHKTARDLLDLHAPAEA